MKVIADTSVWSLALRRNRRIENQHSVALASLIRAGRIQMLGPVRQELLSGVREKMQFEKLRNHLRAFPDLPLTTDDHELAAQFFNACRMHGIQGSNTDFLLCAVSYRHEMPLLTADDDFSFFSRYIPVRLLDIASV